MAKIDSFKRWLLLINKLKKNPSSFKDLRNYLINQEEISGYRLEISQRTFQRDIKDIENYFGIEINFNRNKNLYEIFDGYNDVSVDRIIEAFNIATALKISEKVAENIYIEKRKSKGTEYFHGILHAAKNNLEVSFEHESFWNDDIKKRKCVPIAIKEAQHRWYLIGFDTEVMEIRNYGLDRISNFEILPKRIEILKINVEDYYKNAFGIETYSKAQKIVLEFENSQKKYLMTLPFHPTQRIVKENKDTFIVELFMHPTYDFIMEILRFGNWCEVIEPITYREQIKDIVKKMNKKYGK